MQNPVQEKKTGAALPTPEALSSPGIEEKAQAVAEGKVKLSFRTAFMLSVAAGFFIGIGGLYFALFVSDSALPFSVQRLLGGLVFALGLSLVIVCGAELFTGNALMVNAWLSGRIRGTAMLRNWVTVWCGNFAGALVLVALVMLSGTDGFGNLAGALTGIAAGKVSASWSVLFFKGILCNVMVCLAVWMGFAGRSVTDKVVAILLPISAFVALGFEHCVANMFFLPAGALIAQETGAAAASVLTVSGIAFNLSAVTLGNIAGGAMVGLVYWAAYRSGK